MAPPVSSESARARRAAKAIDALRRGWPIGVEAADGVLNLLPVETVDLDQHLSSRSEVKLLISSSRADTLKLLNQRASADPALPVQISLTYAATAEEIIAIADPVLDMQHPMKGPFLSEELAHPEAAKTAMELARHGGLLPAFLVMDEPAEDKLRIDDVTAYADSNALVISAHAKLPVAADAKAHIYGFRSEADSTDHVALVVGERDETTPVVRLHSECLTGDVLGSLKCDCGPQLHAALGQMSEANWGVLLYLRQEGRGIGLINKLRAYALQDQGFDTVDANQRLGFAIDARDFSIAARMLDLLNIPAVKLLTNNPEKVEGLEGCGVSVEERLPVKIAANPHNEYYLDTKRDRTGHKL
ncbi:GTP cyclohydrolase II [Parasphingorhabdus cellanae]|uniref:GTP cyclohydrolase-2 n=1 Tax=Parasphingorhabdus cellanae TaxID=2806553 RepID=A0ABX7T9G4_9SPHN|nr:GTP cyclohydrolase II [Parasphingorhabdus cellanae]QTD56985.1 GTP cyclohydrolase II [Parasphingorhabdus cellanae]